MRTLSRCLLIAMVLTGCSKEPEYTGPQRVCIANQYKDYDAKQLNQCVNVCRSCMGGNTLSATTLPYAEVPQFVTHVAATVETAAMMRRFLILTACRTNEELAEARLSEIDRRSSAWKIPADA